MTTPEIIWLVHIETIESLKEHSPRKLRPYLISVGDEAELRSWDQEQMKKSREGKGNDPRNK